MAVLTLLKELQEIYLNELQHFNYTAAVVFLGLLLIRLQTAAVTGGEGCGLSCKKL